MRTLYFKHYTERPYICQEDELSCANGYCADLSARCDGYNDCLDWTDEMQCCKYSNGDDIRYANVMLMRCNAVSIAMMMISDVPMDIMLMRCNAVSIAMVMISDVPMDIMLMRCNAVSIAMEW